jgi:hypothetical protein
MLEAGRRKAKEPAMGYVLLWIECLTGSLLFVALMLAMIGRLRRRWLRNTLAAVAFLPPLSVLLLWTFVAAVLRAYTDRWFAPAVILTGCYCIGAVGLWWRALRCADEQAVTTAAGWPRCKLAVGFGGAIVAAMATVWIIDIQIQQRLLEIRAEARALALSVAPPTLPDAENAALVYAEAFEAMEMPGPADDAWLTKWYGRADRAALSDDDLQDAALDSFLQSKASALALLREAASVIDCSFDHRYCQKTYDMMVPEFDDLRHAAEYLYLSARWNIAHDKSAAAMEDINAMLGMVDHVASEPLTLHASLAARIDRCALLALQALLGTFGSTPDELAAIHLRPTPDFRKTLQRSLRSEEAFTLGAACEIGLGADFNALWYGGCGEPLYDLPACEQVYRLFVLEGDLAASRRYWRECDAALREQSTGSRGAAGDRLAQWRNGLLTRLLGPAVTAFAHSCTVADARRRVARTALAAAKFQAEERELPESLDELVPDFLLAVPFDPFDGKPLRMKRTARGIVVYSIGPDGIDDGGKPLDEPDKTGDITFELPDRKPPAI